MGLLNKLKNVLFEEEEVEETIEEPKVKPVSKNTMEFPKVTKIIIILKKKQIENYLKLKKHLISQLLMKKNLKILLQRKKKNL